MPVDSDNYSCIVRIVNGEKELERKMIAGFKDIGKFNRSVKETQYDLAMKWKEYTAIYVDDIRTGENK